ncbi:MAG: tetratricopeptide repeat protein [Spirochaetales bacterium]|nr:tetratricopeptide repeat protein [Spirochaetales bacterium]
MKTNRLFVAAFALAILLAPLSAQSSKKAKQAKDAKEADVKEEKAFSVGEFAKSLSDTASTAGIEEALKLFDTIPEENKNEYAVRYMHSSLLLSAGRAKEAKPIAAALLAEYKKDKDVLFLNALIAKDLGERNKKSEYLQELIKIDPYNPEANAELGNEKMTAKAYKDAKGYFLKSMRGDPDYITGLFGYGQVCYYLGEFKESKTAFNRILTLNPREDIAWSYLAKLSAEKEEYPDAIKYVLKAIEYNPTYYNYWIDYGDYLRYSSKYEEAAKAFSRAIEITPDYFLAYVYRASMYEILEKNDLALADYKSVVKLNSQYQYAYESIGILSWLSGKWTDCREAMQKAYAVDTDNISYQLMISACYQKEGDKLKNKEFLTKMMKNLDRQSAEYAILRLYFDGLGEADVLRKIRKVESVNLKGKLLYYMAVFYELNGSPEAAKTLYLEIQSMNSPMFFEYRLAKQALEKSNGSLVVNPNAQSVSLNKN